MFEDDGAADEDMPRAPLSYRQHNAAKARDARQQKPRSRPPVLDVEVVNKVNKVKAAQDLLACGLRTSLRSFSHRHDIEISWARRLLMMAGSVFLEEQRKALRRLLLEIRDLVSKGDVRGALFTWWRSYDETQRLCRFDSYECWRDLGK